MITEHQEKYLNTLPEDETVSIHPWDPRTREVAEKLVKEIKDKSNLAVLWTGASALEIAGQNDIDLHILCEPSQFDEYLPVLQSILGKPKNIKPTFIEWRLILKGVDIDCYLTDPTSPHFIEQVEFFELLKENPKLTKEYGELKQECDGLPIREYQRRKYEFYNRVLKIES